MAPTIRRLAALLVVGILTVGCNDDGGEGDDGVRDNVGGEESPGGGDGGADTEGGGSGGDQGEPGISGGG